MDIVVRRFREEDAEAVAALIQRNMLEVNSRDYSPESIQAMVESHDAQCVLRTASYAHMYVLTDGDEGEIVGVGAISSFWGSLTESILLTIFVKLELHGQGLGTKIIRTLESDELFLRASRIEIPASITGAPFYEKMGYGYKNGKVLDDEGFIRMEKFR